MLKKYKFDENISKIEKSKGPWKKGKKLLSETKRGKEMLENTPQGYKKFLEHYGYLPDEVATKVAQKFGKAIGKPYSQQKRQHGKGAGKIVDVHKQIEAELPAMQESYNRGYGKDMLERRLLVKYGGAFGADIDRLLKKIKSKKGSKQYTCDKCGEATDKIYGGPGNDLCKECAKNEPKEPYKGYNRGALPPTGLTAEQEDQMLEEGLERAREGREPDIEPDFDAMKDDKE